MRSAKQLADIGKEVCCIRRTRVGEMLLITKKGSKAFGTYGALAVDKRD